MSDFFQEPARLLWLIAVAAGALAWIFAESRARRMLLRLGEQRLIRELVDPAAGRRQACFVLGIAALAAGVVASARPQFGTKLTEIRRRGNDVFIAIDVSTSMLAEDMPPSRLDKAKRSLGLLVSQLKGDRIGIIAFAGDAFLACPMTLDVEAAGMFLESVDTTTVPVPGTAIGKTVRRAIDHFPRSSRARKILVLITDGEETRDSDPLGAAREATKAGVSIYPLGLGTPQGDVIKFRDSSGAVTGFKKDDKGETVLSRLDEATLIEMARLTGGEYARSTPGDDEILALAGRISAFAHETQSTQAYRVREERYQIPLLIAILLLLAEAAIPLRTGYYRALWADLNAPRRIRFPRVRLPSLIRRRSTPLVAAALAAALALASPARCDFRSDMNRGNKLCVAGNMEAARQEYFNAQASRPEAAEAPYNIGNTYLFEGNHDEALKFYASADALARNPALKSLIAYNRGCALFRAGKESEAVESFKDALRWNPGDADAKYNIEWIRNPKRPKKPQGQPKPQQGKQSQEKMSKEDAERLLQMVRDKERKAREESQKAKKGKEKEGSGGKDW